MKKIIVLSQSKIKKDAILEVFSNIEYDISFVKIPDNPYRPSQPLFIDGTQDACNNRINEYLLKYGEIDKDSVIISIENGILAIDTNDPYNILSPQHYEYNWADFCTIGIYKYGCERKFVISPCIVHIKKEYSEPYFKSYFGRNKEIDTLGKYIAKYGGDNISHNNWMKDVAGIDRVLQIKLGLIIIKNIIFIK